MFDVLRFAALSKSVYPTITCTTQQGSFLDSPWFLTSIHCCVQFEGETLFQGRDEGTPVYLIRWDRRAGGRNGRKETERGKAERKGKKKGVKDAQEKLDG